MTSTFERRNLIMAHALVEQRAVLTDVPPDPRTRMSSSLLSVLPGCERYEF